MKKRAIVIVLDSVGIGELPDSADFADEGANTLGNINSVRPLNVPNLIRLGIGNIVGSTLEYTPEPIGAYGKAAEVTKAKDTTSGHWEMMGVPMYEPFKTYPQGFPAELIERFEKNIGIGVLGNEVASGTEIIQRLGDAHVRTGRPIVYTSADSVFQIAAHEAVIPLDRLYSMCETARDMLVGEYLVGRVIARPFLGENGKYHRTENRKDYALAPDRDTVLDALTADGLSVIAIGKIEDIFAHRGISIADHTKNNRDGIEAVIKHIKSGEGDLIFANLVDFDMLYGHRNDVEGYAAALEYFDSKIPAILSELKVGDMLIITADHGCDPCHGGTDHTREYIPLLVFGKDVLPKDLGILGSFADIGASVYDYLTGKSWHVGKSFIGSILKQ